MVQTRIITNVEMNVLNLRFISYINGHEADPELILKGFMAVLWVYCQSKASDARNPSAAPQFLVFFCRN